MYIHIHIHTYIYIYIYIHIYIYIYIYKIEKTTSNFDRPLRISKIKCVLVTSYRFGFNFL